MGGGGGQPATTHQVTKVELPAWVDEASQANYKFAQDVAGQPLQQQQGRTVANPSEYGNTADYLTKAYMGSTDYMTAAANDIYKNTANPLDINRYLNPYTSEVENRAIGNANLSLQKNLGSNLDAAQKAKAFGGSRYGIQNAVTQSEATRGIGDLSAALRKQGIDFATSTALADRQGMQASAAGLLNTAQTKKMAEAADIGQLRGSAGREEQFMQKVWDQVSKQFYEYRDYPKEQLNIRLAALGMSPYGKTETVDKTSTSEKQGTDWATVGLGALKTIAPLFGMLSDRNTKTDIKKLTDGPIPMYAYRYKGDPKTYPKLVGPMAQDIEKLHPSAVKKVGKHKVVDIHNLMEVLS